MKKYSLILVLVLVLSSILSCSGEEQKNTNPPGFTIIDNGYDFDMNYIKISFVETLECMEYDYFEPKITIEITAPYKPFPCAPNPKTGCGGLYEVTAKVPSIKLSADFVRLKHEYIHYALDYYEGDADPGHLTDHFNRCEK